MEIDCHFIKEKIEGGIVRLMYTPSSCQTGDILTKALPKTIYENMKSKLGMLDIYHPTGGGVWKCRIMIMEIWDYDLYFRGILI